MKRKNKRTKDNLIYPKFWSNQVVSKNVWRQRNGKKIFCSGGGDEVGSSTRKTNRKSGTGNKAIYDREYMAALQCTVHMKRGLS